MNIREIKSYEDEAINTVVSIINKAHEKLGVRQNLFQIAQRRDIFANQAKLSLSSLGPPLAVTGEKFIEDAITKKWHLGETFKHVLKYLGGSKDECSQYYYYEAIFSQPTAAYPIPQATASVFFRIEDKHIDPPKVRVTPTMVFRIEGSNTNHDVHYVMLIPDWLLAVMQMKIKFFKRLEQIEMF